MARNDTMAPMGGDGEDVGSQSDVSDGRRHLGDLTSMGQPGGIREAAKDKAAKTVGKAANAAVSSVASPVVGKVAGKVGEWATANPRKLVLLALMPLLVQAMVLALPFGAILLATGGQATARSDARSITSTNAQQDGVIGSASAAYRDAASRTGIEWEVLAAIGAVVNEHGGQGLVGPPGPAPMDEDEDATVMTVAEPYDGPPIWPVSAEPIVETSGTTRYVTAMLIRDDVTDLDPTQSARSVEEVARLLGDALRDHEDYRPTTSFEFQTDVYVDAVGMLPLMGLDPDAGAGTTTGVAMGGSGKAQQIVDMAMGWRNSCEAGPGSTDIALLATNGPINVGDRLHDGREVSPVMMGHAQTIVREAKQFAVPERGMVVGLMTALQESGLVNLANAKYPESLAAPHDDVAPGDHDSGGLFQQRPQAGWGSYAQVQDPVYSARAFFGVGPDDPPNGDLMGTAGWETMPLTVAAQTVQISAFPDAYAKWEADAAGLVESILPALESGGTTTTVSTGDDTTSTTPPDPGTDTSTEPAGPGEPSASPTAPSVQAIAAATDAGCGGAGSTVLFTTYDGPVRTVNGPPDIGPILVADVPTPGGGTITVAADMADSLVSLLESAHADGITMGGGGFRSHESQIALRIANGCPDIYISPSSTCDVPTARPGSSNHEVGRAVDFTYNGQTICFPSSTASCTGNPASDWMQANAAAFGWINFPAEAWHYSDDGT